MRTLTLFTILILSFGCKQESGTSDSCGDGVIDVGEECDGINLGGDTCASLGYHGGTLACDDQCNLILTECEAAGQCGDDIIQTQFGETCEPGISTENCNELGHGSGEATCDANCHWDLTNCSGAASCGDGVVEGIEECEAEDMNGQTCLTLGYYGGTLACTPQCIFNTSSCEGYGWCGDNDVQANHDEECDLEDFAGETCETLGYYGGTLACNNLCLLDVTNCEGYGWCGDGEMQEADGEECDDTDFGAATCADFGGYRGTLQCTEECLADNSGCERCGDGILQGGDGETCDGTDFGGDTCESLGYYGGELGCDPFTCQRKIDMCAEVGRCGDGVIQGGYSETCDGTEFGGDSCLGRGFYGGTLSCSTACETDASACEGSCGDGIAQTTHESCDGTDLAGETCLSLGYGAGGELECDLMCNWAVSGCEQFTAIAAGAAHTCARTNTGRVWCWGDNTYGQLGDGSTTASSVPVEVFGGHIFTSITAGSNHTCAVTDAGSAYCWGANNKGQLGDGTTTESHFPIPVAGGRIFGALSAGGEFTCGVTAGYAYCWGSNSNGQLGDNTTIDRLVPVQLYGMITSPSFSSVTAGGLHACGIERISGGTMCWGSNQRGQLGIGNNIEQHAPIMVPGYTFSSVSAGGGHTCGIDASGASFCWGNNSSGQLGNGTTT
ncbi:hypothetical protein KKF84_18535, partial [Myxococcota bacterium]|nr:hypothetical protein [Myxococcota bacterium]